MTARPRLLIELLDYDNPVLRSYAFWMSILVIKMLLMSLLTAVQRMRTKAFANPEDLRMAGVKEVKFDEPRVERARRAHRNDLESILPYLIVGFMYVLTDPPVTAACILFGVVCSCRMLHTVVYAVYVLPQPARALSFFVPLGITAYMAGYTAFMFFLMH